MTDKTPKEAAQILNISYAAILSYLAAGVFPGAVKNRGTRWVVPDSAIADFKKGRLSVAGTYRESSLERRLRAFCEGAGLRCVKFSDPARKGAPDRLVLGGGGLALYIETKTPVGKMSPHQNRYHRWLKEQGHRVICANNFGRARFSVRDFFGVL